MSDGSDARFSALIAAMRDVPVLVAGDIMLDRFTYGHVERISPESPVPVLTVDREDIMLGGAGNALANIMGLGAQGRVLAVVGDDDYGRQVRQKAEEMGLDVSGLIIDPARPTTIKTRYLAGHQQLLRTDFERSEPVSEELAARIVDEARRLLKDVKAVVLSDYGKGLFRQDVIEGIISEARAKNIPVIVDPKGQDFSIYKGASAVTPNRKELSEATRGMNTKTDEEVVQAAGQVIEECGIDAVVATRSQDGMSVVQKDAPPLHLRSAEIEVFDVSGAGDTVIATVATALAAGADLQEAAALANVAGSIVVTKVGTAPIRGEELLQGVQTDAADVLTGADAQASSINRTRQAPLSGWQEAQEQVRRWRTRGLKIGFTNGCFDILHKGHVSYLNQAREHCDRLIVALNNDTSVHLLKGEGRPVHDADSRAAVLGALGSVDMVVLFGAEEEGADNTANSLLELLQPDVYFKGGDYTVDQIPEAPVVQAYGGKVSVMPVYEGHSTTSSIKKMSNEAA